ncbi:DUF2634 domain-containing protein [Cytobacillus massiliigabonensis]|uniref:DUF2634 domain-containing protein n=1 Tax=Cytobacillus massiliigabonensis TaxID=1871011 RepID=UPI000C847ECF|nr:DUF2634 domain-containing protein [Cytobacillus massiliigabonensis]
MIPRVNGGNDDLDIEFEEERRPSKTYKLDLVRKRVIGYTDGREAIEQAIYKAIGTERYDHLIYSWNYGAEIAKLFGQPIPYVYSELKRLISEALTQDDRIDSVDAFSFSHQKNKVFVSFIVHTVVGEISIETEVPI